MALSPAEMNEAIVRNLEAKTGRGLEEWLEVVGQHSVEMAPAGIAAWLKQEHGLGHVTAQVIARHAVGAGNEHASGEEGFLLRLFGAPGSPRRRQYADLCEELGELVPNTRVTVCKGYVGFSNGRQYAAVRSTGSGLELGLRLPVAGELLTPVRGLGGGSIGAGLAVEGPLDEEAKALVRAAAGLVGS